MTTVNPTVEEGSARCAGTLAPVERTSDDQAAEPGPAGHRGTGWLAPTVGALLAVGACLPLLVVIVWPGIDLRRTDDGEQFLLRALTLDHALALRPAYPRWLPDLYLGYGYPVFSFYSPLAYLLVAVIAQVGAVTVDVAARVAVAGIVLLGGIGAATLARAVALGDGPARSRTRGIAVGVTGAVAYVGAPYPFITNLFMRGDLPEALALAILPWFWLAVRRLLRVDGSMGLTHVSVAGLLAAALILVHQLSALMAAVAMAFVVVGHAARLRSPTVLARVALSGAIAVGTTAILWMPLAVESGAVRLGVVGHGVPEVLARLAPAWAPVVAGWPFAYGWDLVRAKAPDGPVLPGVVQGGIVAAVALSGALARWRGRGRPPVRHRWRAGDTRGVVLVVGACWLLNLEPSTVIWSDVEPLRIIQFPWRLLGPLSLGVALLAAMAVSLVGGAMAVGAAVVVGGLSWADSLGGLSWAETTDGAAPYTVAAMVREDYAHDRWGASTTTGDGEFTPRAVDIRRPDGSLGGAVRLDRVAPPGAWVGGLAMVQAGEGHVSSLHGDATRLRVVVEAGEAGATLAIHQLDFPGWRATVDGTRVGVQAAPLVPGSGVAPGWVTVAVSPGRHEVAVWFGATRPRLVGAAITCAALAALGVALWREWRRGKSRPVGTTMAVGALLGLATWNLAAEAWTVRAPPAASPATERVVLDVVDAVRRGDATLGSPSGARLGPESFLDAGWLDVRPPPGRPVQVGTRRRWLYMHAPSRATVRLRIPAGGAIFQSGLALRPDAWEVPIGDGVHFVAEVEPVDGNGGMRTLWFQRVNPRANLDERRWVEVRGDLGEWAGREVNLTLRTEPVDSVAYDWAGWGNPLVVVPSGILRPANGPQPPASIIAPRTWMVDQ